MVVGIILRIIVAVGHRTIADVILPTAAADGIIAAAQSTDTACPFKTVPGHIGKSIAECAKMADRGRAEGMRRAGIVGFGVVDRRPAAVCECPVKIRRRLPLPFRRQPPAVIARKRCCAVPAYMRYRVIFKLGLHRK